MSWADLDELIAPVAECKNGVVVLCFDTCYGLEAFNMYRFPRVRQFVALVGPNEYIEPKKSLRAFCAFYESYFSEHIRLPNKDQISLKEITEAIKGHIDRAVIRMSAPSGYPDGRFQWVDGFSAMALANKITDPATKTPLENGFTAYEVYRRQWSGVNTYDLIRAALARLEEAHWIRSIFVPPSKNGGKPTFSYEINPEIIRPCCARKVAK